MTVITSSTELPAHWSWASIAETCERPEYGHTASAETNCLGPKFLRITDIQEIGVAWHQVPYCECSERALARLLLSRGDILVARIGATTGKTHLVRDCPEAVFASYLIRLRARTVDPEFLYYFTKSQLYWNQVDAYKGDKLKGGISGSVLATLRHPLPPPAEQRAIARTLSALESRLLLEHRRVRTLQVLKAATMAKIFSEGLLREPLAMTEIGDLPRSWKITRCESLAEIISVGIVVTPAKYYVDSGVPCFRSFNIRQDRLVARDLVFISKESHQLHVKSELRAGDVLVVRTGDPGTACVVPETFDRSNCVDLLFVRPDVSRVIPDYLSRFLNSTLGQRQSGLARTGLAQKHLNVSALRKVLIPVPSRSEQQEISGIGAALDSRILKAEASFALLQEAFGSTLPALVTGRIRIGVAEHA